MVIGEERDTDSPPPPLAFVDGTESLSLAAPRAFYEDYSFERALREAHLKTGEIVLKKEAFTSFLRRRTSSWND